MGEWKDTDGTEKNGIAKEVRKDNEETGY